MAKASALRRLGLIASHNVNQGYFDHTFNGLMAKGILAGLSLPERAGKTFTGHAAATGMSWSGKGVAVQLLGPSAKTLERTPPLDAMRKIGCDALICLNILENDWLEKLLKLGLPVVLADYPHDTLRGRADAIFVDPLPAFRMAVRHFVSRGLKRIGFVGMAVRTPANTPELTQKEWFATVGSKMRIEPDSYLRLNAYKQVLDEEGLDVPDNGIHFASYSPGNIGALADRLLDEPPKRRPQALLAHDHATVNAIAKRFRERGQALEGAGAAARPAEGPALPLLADGRELGALALELVRARLASPQRPYLSVGMALKFKPPAAKGASRTKAT